MTDLCQSLLLLPLMLLLLQLLLRQLAVGNHGVI
jgi:hypothetical protein